MCLQHMFKRLIEPIRKTIATVYERDPAARNFWEIVTCYTGLHAILIHKISRFLWKNHLKTIARMLSTLARWWTGIEIHPGAKIGRRFFIDHGTGVVIGETSEIHDDVTMYQGAVLGGTSWTKGKRHPTLEEHVVVGAHTVLLGPITIGHHSRIGAGSVVVHDVPPHSTVVGIPGRVVRRLDENLPHSELEHGTIPDPFWDAIESLETRLKALEDRLK